jgi:hypothetical protein
MLLQHLIHSAKVHPWWIVGFPACLLILTALRSFLRAKPSAPGNPQFLSVPSQFEGENQGQLKRTIRLGFLHRKGFHSACQVVVLTRELPGSAPLVVARYIQSVEMSLPGGEYKLSLAGVNLKARHVDSAWEVYL